MSDGPIPLIGPDDLKYVPVASDFSGMVADELGDLGTAADGFDAIFEEAANLAGEAGSILSSFDQDLADASTNLAAFDPTETTNILAGLQPASDATDAALAGYNSDIPPDPTASTTSGTGSGSGGQTEPFCSLPLTLSDPTDFPDLPRNQVAYLAQGQVGCIPPNTQLISHYFPPYGYFLSPIVVRSGDPAVFTFSVLQGSHDPNDQTNYGDEIDIAVNSAKAGRFLARIGLYEENGNADLGIVVQILPAATT
jgi:hypothetical protein